MAKKINKSTTHQTDKILTVAGLLVVVLGIIANIYNVYINQLFVSDLLFFAYNIRFVLLLGGGFLIGYFIAKHAKKVTLHDKLYRGVCYAILAVALYVALDPIQLVVKQIFGELAYPWSSFLSLGAPILSIVLAILVAYWTQYKQNNPFVSARTKLLLIILFVIYQINLLANSVYFMINGAATFDPDMPSWLIISNYFTIPLVIAFIAYVLLRVVPSRFNRLYYAAFIGLTYSILNVALWRFRTDPSYDATNIFSVATTIITLLFAGIMIWKVRKSVR